jgi:hypothetical protein
MPGEAPPQLHTQACCTERRGRYHHNGTNRYDRYGTTATVQKHEKCVIRAFLPYPSLIIHHLSSAAQVAADPHQARFQGFLGF